MSSSYGGFHNVPTSTPFTRTLATSLMSSNFSASFSPGVFSGISNSAEYSAMPEKFAIPLSPDFVHDSSLLKIACSGAPRPLWNFTLYGGFTSIDCQLPFAEKTLFLPSAPIASISPAPKNSAEALPSRDSIMFGARFWLSPSIKYFSADSASRGLLQVL